MSTSREFETKLKYGKNVFYFGRTDLLLVARFSDFGDEFEKQFSWTSTLTLAKTGLIKPVTFINYSHITDIC